MTTKIADHSSKRGLGASLRAWGMMLLTLIFVLLYGAALIGWIKPLTDDKLISRLEPIIFVILGYYFGRLPSQQNESTLKEELNRQMQRFDAAQHAKEQMQQIRESLEEKMKNVRAALAVPIAGKLGRESVENFNGTDGKAKDEVLQQSIDIALSILNS